MIALAAAALLTVALLLGPAAFAAAVVAAAVLTALDASDRLARASRRPVVVAALVPAGLMPAVAALTPASGWERLPSWVAGTVLGTFLVVLVFGRRAAVVEALGATALVALVVGLGATALVLLRDLPDGFRWVLAVLVLVAGTAAARQLAVRRELLAVMAVLMLLGAVAAATLAPPLSPVRAALLALSVLVGSAVAEELQRVLGVPSPARPLDATAVLLLAAPAAYLVARSGAL